MFAVSRGHPGMVDLLLDAGAEINEADNVSVFYHALIFKRQALMF